MTQAQFEHLTARIEILRDHVAELIAESQGTFAELQMITARINQVRDLEAFIPPSLRNGRAPLISEFDPEDDISW